LTQSKESQGHLSKRVECGSWLNVTCVRLAYGLTTKTFGRGYRTAMRLIALLVRATRAQVIFDDCARFSFPLADDYWSRLVVGDFQYEPEIAQVMNKLRERRFVFVDAGANFGYWSVLASSRLFGSQRAVAIEASIETLQRLQENCTLNERRFEVIHAAVSDEDGRLLSFGTGHHTVRRLVEDGDGERVISVTIDSIVHARLTSPGEIVVVKLDVEGGERAALAGARDTIANCEFLIIYEDHGNDSQNEISRHIIEDLGLAVGRVLPTGDIEAVRSAESLSHVKLNPRKGYNFVATKHGSSLHTELWRPSF
jgi:FkbM family methyltransferase